MGWIENISNLSEDIFNVKWDGVVIIGLSDDNKLFLGYLTKMFGL